MQVSGYDTTGIVSVRYYDTAWIIVSVSYWYRIRYRTGIARTIPRACQYRTGIVPVSYRYRMVSYRYRTGIVSLSYMRYQHYRTLIAIDDTDIIAPL